MKTTREELVVQVAKMKEDVEQRQQNDLTRRKEFARSFGWNNPQRQYSSDKELYEPTWVEVFIKLGKLLACRDFRDIEGNVSEIECRLDDLESKIKKEIHPNP